MSKVKEEIYNIFGLTDYMFDDEPNSQEVIQKQLDVYLNNVANMLSERRK